MVNSGSEEFYNPTIQLLQNLVKQVAAGMYHYIYLKMDGTVWSVGRNSTGQLGDGTTQDSLSVQVLNEDGSPFNEVDAISAGLDHTYF